MRTNVFTGFFLQGNAILVCLIKFLEEKTIKVKDYTLCPWYFLSMLTAIEVVSILIVLTKYLGNNFEKNLTHSS